MEVETKGETMMDTGNSPHYRSDNKRHRVSAVCFFYFFLLFHYLGLSDYYF